MMFKYYFYDHKISRTPDSGFFVRMSGFLKSTYLESTYYGEFLNTKILLDKFCPGSGFALNRSFSDIFLILTLKFIQNYYKLRFYMSRIFPGCQNPNFCCTVRFLKSIYFPCFLFWIAMAHHTEHLFFLFR